MVELLREGTGEVWVVDLMEFPVPGPGALLLPGEEPGVAHLVGAGEDDLGDGGAGALEADFHLNGGLVAGGGGVDEFGV